MDRYAKSDDAGFIVRDYGGPMMIKKSKRAGRSLFFAYYPDEPTTLVLLLAYKKEGDDAPERLLNAARERMGRYIESRRRP